MKKVSSLLLFACVFVLITAEGEAEQLGIRYVRHLQKEERLETFFILTGEFSFDTLDAIRNGLTAKLFLTFQLSHAPGLMGIGKQIVNERTENFTISYDVWENSFLIENRRRKKGFSVPISSDILKIVTETVNPLRFRCSSVGQNDRLMVRGKIKVQTIKLFPPFGLFLVFYNPWNFESGWIQSDTFTLKDL